jgi:hypothetical protein
MKKTSLPENLAIFSDEVINGIRMQRSEQLVVDPIIRSV